MKGIGMVNRRNFLKGVFSAGALVLSVPVAPFKTSAAAEQSSTGWKPSVYLGIETDGSVILVATRSEMGQGVRTSLPMILADELDADWERVRIEQAIGDPGYGGQDTDGSKSIRTFFGPMREAGATAKYM